MICLGDRGRESCRRSRVWFSSTTATATFGSSAGAKQMNQVVLTLCDAGLGRAGLAGDRGCPGSARRCRCRPDDGLHHHRVSVGRRAPALIGAAELVRAGARDRRRRPGAMTRSTRYGCITTPPFATAAATIAICSGVTSSRSCPNASRPGSTCVSGRRVEEVGRSCRARSPCARRPASRAAGASRSRTASRSRGSRPAPICLPMLQKTELIECCERLEERHAAERPPGRSGRPKFETFLPYSTQ